VAATLDVPPLPAAAEASAGSEGGEWELLVGKVRAWLEQADLPGQWERLGGPLRGLGLLLGLLLVLKLYVALLDTLDDLPLLPRLLQLLGLITLVRFSITRLTRSSDRQVVFDSWKRRWDAFRGS
jgi:predicted lipid-binding transport protein (Tim44 family)